MSNSNLLSRGRLGDKFQLRRSNTREAADLDITSSFDPDSSFASSSAISGDVSEEKVWRAKPGSLSALGARVRSMSTGTKKSMGEETEVSLPKVNRSKSSLFDEVKRSSRSSRLFDALGLKSKSELVDPSTSPGLETENVNPVDSIPHSITPRPRLSVSGISTRFNRTSSYFSMESTSPMNGTVKTSASPGEFNLRSFRNVRRQDSNSSYPIPPALKSSAASPPIPMSSASQYMTLPTSESRTDSFVSAEESHQNSTATSPRILSPSNNVSDTDLSPSESKQSSPRMEPLRFQGGSILAGRFRKVTTVSVRSSEDTNGGVSTPTEGFQRSLRPNSPFLNMSASPSQTLAALEAEMAKGRTTPLMFLHQGEDFDAKLPSPQPRSPSKSTRVSTSRQASGDGLQSYQGSPFHQASPLEPKQANDIAPPKLPWLREETEIAKRRRQSSTSYSQSNGSRGELLSPLANVNPIGDLRDVLPRSVNGLPTLQIDQNGSAFPKSRAMSASPTQEEDVQSRFSTDETTGLGIGQRIQRWSMFNGATLNESKSKHRRGESSPMESIVTRPSLPTNGHRRANSTLSNNPTLGQLKADELLSFHEKQAPLLLAAQNRTEILPNSGARIAWPSPPCIKLEYFSHLTALHQHSLYEQHCKAANHALSEYMRLMAGVVPVDALTQPGPIFNTGSSLQSRQSFYSNKGRQSSESSAMHHSRSRSISVPGLHGGSGSQSRRRSLTPAKLKSEEVPVPPLPSESMLEKMEERIQNSRTSTPLLQASPSSNDFNSSKEQILSRRPSAKFMLPQHASLV